MITTDRFKHLNPDQIVSTVGRLAGQINAAFPSSGLSQVCEELLAVSRVAKARAAAIRRPNYPLRVASILLAVVVVIGLGAAIASLKPRGEPFTFVLFVQALEAAINDVVLIGAGIFFLMTFDNRLKRRRALQAMHELRSLAHIIDMHQLAKDPAGLVREDTSAEDKLPPEQLILYLDFCSEMLSLCGKLAALYIQEFNDPSAVAAVDEIESLTNGLSRKIWQKMTMVQSQIMSSKAR